MKDEKMVANKEVVIRVAHLFSGESERCCRRVVNGFLQAIASELQEGRSVKLRNFGYFSVYNAKARTGRNPVKECAVPIPARARVRFKPADCLQPSSDKSAIEFFKDE